jgi:hypothetical protein
MPPLRRYHLKNPLKLLPIVQNRRTTSLTAKRSPSPFTNLTSMHELRQEPRIGLPVITATKIIALGTVPSQKSSVQIAINWVTREKKRTINK